MSASPPSDDIDETRAIDELEGEAEKPEDAGTCARMTR
jgi:hypothetical protein